MAMLISGIGLVRFARFAQKLAVLVLLSLFILPFIPPLADDKSAPFLIAYGAIGLYYVLRKSARKIFDPLPKGNSAYINPKRRVVRNLIYSLLALIVLGVIYIVYDMSQAKQQAVDVCKSAKKGMLVNNFLAAFSENDFKIIMRPESVMLVPLRGLGRNHCTIMHDGVIIEGSKAGFSD
jgi:cbb3-type cytochrome oxidase subunit 3